MPYVKISDPNTIDLASWQQVVNVVNQHSDSINAITNNFGAQAPAQSAWSTTEDFAYEYDPNSQKIISGRTRLDPTDSSFQTANGGYVHYKDVIFTQVGATAFSAAPTVVVTGRHTSTLESLTNNLDIMITVQEVTSNQFTIRIVNARSKKNTETGTVTAQDLDQFVFYVNWIALGPK
jgi:hypothetical protein